MAFLRTARSLAGVAGLFARRAVCRRGQTAIEYLLLIAMVVALAVTIFTSASDILRGGFFTLVGLIVPAGS
ncbi:MAG: class III signal peptide-containing protein [Elusimicrobiaceae bacterium]|nr:class III signal peptide-containing protein [Elusimicrobiaceae bacterium]